MIVTESMVYWITRLDGIKYSVMGVAIGATIMWSVILSVSAVTWFGGSREDDRLRGKHLFTRTWPFLPIVLMFLWMAFVLIPTTKEMCAIKIIPLVANNEDVQDIPNNIVKLANEWIEELRPETKTGKSKQETR